MFGRWEKIQVNQNAYHREKGGVIVGTSSSSSSEVSSDNIHSPSGCRILHLHLYLIHLHNNNTPTPMMMMICYNLFIYTKYFWEF